MTNPSMRVFENRHSNNWSHHYDAVVRRTKCTTVVAPGCFDVLHAGHVHTLNWAKARPWIRRPYLIVALNSDESVRALKGDGHPRVPFGLRAYALASLRCVDAVVGFDEENPLTLLHHLPGCVVLVKGDEYDVDDVEEGNFVARRGGAVVFAPMVKGISSSAVLDNAVGAGMSDEDKWRLHGPRALNPGD